MKKVTPEILAIIILETEIQYEEMAYKRMTKLFSNFLAGKAFYKKDKDKFKIIYK